MIIRNQLKRINLINKHIKYDLSKPEIAEAYHKYSSRLPFNPELWAKIEALAKAVEAGWNIKVNSLSNKTPEPHLP